MSGNQHDPDPDAVDARIDALARERGSELRRPAPADGLAHVRTVRRRQQAVRTAGGVGVIALLAIGVNAIVTNDDGTVAPADSVVETSTPGTTEPTTTAAPTTTPGTIAGTTPATPPATTPATPAPTTTPVVDDAPNAAGDPSALYWWVGTDLQGNGDQTIVDPVTGAEIRTEPADANASMQAQTEQTARFVLRPTIDEANPAFSYRLESDGIGYGWSARPSDAPPLAESDPDELALYDRCGQSELTVDGASSSVLPARVRNVVMSLDRQRLITIGGECPADGTLVGQTQYVSVDQTVRVFDARDPGAPGRALMTTGDEIAATFFSPDGRYLAVEQFTDQRYQVFDLDSGAEMAIAPEGCRVFGGRYSRFDGPWVGESTLVLSVNCPDQPSALLMVDVATGDQLRVPVPAGSGFPEVSSPDGPFLTVEVDVAHFDRMSNAWFTMCAATADRTNCWYGQPSREPVEIPGALEASFLPLGFTFGG